MGGRGLIDRITFAGGEMGQKLAASCRHGKIPDRIGETGKLRHLGRRHRDPCTRHAFRAGGQG